MGQIEKSQSIPKFIYNLHERRKPIITINDNLLNSENINKQDKDFYCPHILFSGNN